MTTAQLTGSVGRGQQTVKADVFASLVVFLVALPLCLGIALASGMPPVAGILSGIIGGLVVASLGGCSMQVSGPANGLIVVVLVVTQQYGVAVLGAVVLAAGLIQFGAGLFRLGQLFRAVPPAIIHGLMTGFAVIIFASQFHVMLDETPLGTPLANLLHLPGALWSALVDLDGGHQAAGIGILTIVILLAWRKDILPRALATLPASLVAVLAATLAAWAMSLPVARVTLPANLGDAIMFLQFDTLLRLTEWPILQVALIMAFLASTETLLSATAVDRLHQGPRTNYDRELRAQGIGNMLCGVVGAVPLSGVIIRSAANVAAGAQTRLSSVLHGLWMLVFVVALPFLLTQIPTACLAAILVVAVCKLVQIHALRVIWKQDKLEILVYAVTALGIVVFGVLYGVLLGLGLALAKLLYALGRLSIRVEKSPEQKRVDMYLQGTATFISIPRLVAALEEVEPGTELRIHFQELNLIDHASLDLLMNWEKHHERSGGTVFLDWESLHARFEQRAADAAPEKMPQKAPVRETIPSQTQPSDGFFRPEWQPIATLTPMTER
jgi:MFS superfamily sulfate permease-like transporter